MNWFRITYKFIQHYLSAKNTHGFGVHSPYVFHFVKFVLETKSSYYVFSSIEKVRSSLKRDKKILDIVDYGTGSNRTRTIAGIAAKSLKQAKYGQLLYRIADSIKARNVLELGTSLGITTSYLASSSSDIRCVSLEGCQQVADVAIDNFNSLNIKNIQLVIGDIDLTLPKVLNDFDRLDLIFMDANHELQSTLSYFEQSLTKIHNDSVLVVDDIYWSPDMEKAWKRMKEHPRVTSTIDLFQLGIVFFNTDLHKKHYKMRY